MTLKVKKGQSGIHQLSVGISGKDKYKGTGARRSNSNTFFLRARAPYKKTITGNDRENNFLVGTRQSALNHLFLNSSLQRQVLYP